MAAKKDWIDKCLHSAKKVDVLVTGDAVTSMSSLLENVLCERPLRASELTEIAKALLANMATPTTPHVEANHEN